MSRLMDCIHIPLRRYVCASVRLPVRLSARLSSPLSLCNLRLSEVSRDLDVTI